MVNDYVVIDLETSGLRPKHDKIIEIGAIKVKNNEIVEMYQTFINPAIDIKDKTTQITSIEQEDLEHAPYMEEVIHEFTRFLEDLPLVGHNVMFDYSFLKREALMYNIEFEKNGIDTLKIAREKYSQLPSKRLGDMCKHFNIEINAHRALSDAMATHELLQIYMKDGIDVIPRELNIKIKKESPITNRQMELLSTLVKRYNIDIDYEIDRLTKSEASRQIDYIYSNFGR